MRQLKIANMNYMPAYIHLQRNILLSDLSVEKEVYLAIQEKEVDRKALEALIIKTFILWFA